MNSNLAVIESNPELEAIKLAVAELEQKILLSSPEMPNYLKQIHSSLLRNPELVHIIQPSERAVIIAGLMKLTGTIINTPAKKPALSKMSVEDI